MGDEAGSMVDAMRQTQFIPSACPPLFSLSLSLASNEFVRDTRPCRAKTACCPLPGTCSVGHVHVPVHPRLRRAEGARRVCVSFPNPPCERAMQIRVPRATASVVAKGALCCGAAAGGRWRKKCGRAPIPTFRSRSFESGAREYALRRLCGYPGSSSFLAFAPKPSAECLDQKQAGFLTPVVRAAQARQEERRSVGVFSPMSLAGEGGTTQLV